MRLRMSIPELHAFLAEVFPQMAGRFEIVGLEPMRARVRMTAGAADLRPGGTVSGPAMFGLADVAFYIVTLAMIGPEPLTVTTSCAIDFLRKPAPGALVAEARLLKLGRSLAVGDVLLYSEGGAAPVARAGLTYSIPPARRTGGSGKDAGPGGPAG
ncbi:PaaI family thioesterase [Amaricoccus sp.]|uniref:PaaI family thioesterase n=1 Tax=Amaricoccus sp. TaxID=1872485 RepID=UPI001B5318D1|nr:PaaI family thioesterase [Amaricoccus sp.]MBP7001191.1 PaaI family thioesterase [Amaricoccus sp.]